MKCERPARAGEPAWAREGSRGTHTFFRTPCPALKLTITFGGRLGLFFFFKGLSHYIPSKKGKPFVSGSRVLRTDIKTQTHLEGDQKWEGKETPHFCCFRRH